MSYRARTSFLTNFLMLGLVVTCFFWLGAVQAPKVQALAVTKQGSPVISGRLRVVNEANPGQITNIDNLGAASANSRIDVLPAGAAPTAPPVIQLRVNPDGTFTSQNLLSGAETDLVEGNSYYLLARLTYDDNITVNNLSTDPLVAGCVPPAGNKLSRTAVQQTASFPVSFATPTVVNADYPLPLVLVHGLGDCYTAWADWASYLLSRTATVNNAQRIQGRIVFTGSHQFISASYETMANEMVSQLNLDMAGLFQTPPHVRMICHSQGGILARTIQWNFPVWRQRIEKVYTLGTPHSGTQFAASEFFNLNEVQLSKYNTWYPNFKSPVYAVQGTGFLGTSDGLVYPQESLNSLNVLTNRTATDYVPLQTFTPFQAVPFVHNSLLRLPLLSQPPAFLEPSGIPDILERYLLPDFTQPTPPAVPGTTLGSVLQSSTISVDYVILLPIFTQNVTIPVSQTDAVSFAVTIAQGNVGVALVDPTGLVINSTNYQNQPNIGFANTAFGQIFTVYNPRTGNWRVRLSPDIGGGAAAVGANEQSFFRLLGSVNKLAYLPGETAILNARLTGNRSGVTVTSMNATVTDENLQTLASATLFDDGTHNDGAAGDGLYGNTVTVPTTANSYSVAFKASGKNQGFDYGRQAFSLIDVMPTPRLFSGIFSDTSRDDNADTVPDTIVETVGLNLAETGEYLVSADLLDATNYQVSHAVTSVSFTTTGAKTVQLAFDVSQAGCGSFGGAFQVRNLTVALFNGQYTIRDVWTNTLTTQVYNGATFNCGPNPNATPVISSLAPLTGFAGDQVKVTLGGSNFVTGATVQFGGTAATVQVLGPTAALATWTIPPGTPPGPLNVTLTNPDSRSFTLTNGFTVVTDQPPVAGIGFPAQNQRVSGTVTINALAADDRAVQRVEFSIDGALVGTDTTYPYQFVWNTQSPLRINGYHVILVAVFDSLNQSRTASVTVIVANASTTLGVTQFYPVASTSGKTITVFGTNFATGTQVFFGGTRLIPASQVTVVSSTVLQVTVPASATGSGNINGYLTVRSNSTDVTTQGLAQSAVNPGSALSTFPEFVLWGDASGDGSFQASDIALTRAFLQFQAVPTARQLLAVDVVPGNDNGSRGNGQISSVDFSFLRAVSFGQTTF
ncbi:MAG: IPT/TIG domain-containing protein [Blastocatellia bacterium]|nr:IPT/TIG domain-containing protein [Blastocatellia bacterium]